MAKVEISKEEIEKIKKLNAEKGNMTENETHIKKQIMIHCKELNKDFENKLHDVLSGKEVTSSFF